MPISFALSDLSLTPQSLTAVAIGRGKLMNVTWTGANWLLWPAIVVVEPKIIEGPTAPVEVERYESVAAYFRAGNPNATTYRLGEYDDRIEQVIEKVAGLNPHAVPVFPIQRDQSMRQAHLSGSNRPNIDEIAASLRWVEIQTPPENFILVDDVITAGTSFTACKRLINHHMPEAPAAKH